MVLHHLHVRHIVGRVLVLRACVIGVGERQGESR